VAIEIPFIATINQRQNLVEQNDQLADPEQFMIFATITVGQFRAIPGTQYLISLRYNPE